MNVDHFLVSRLAYAVSYALIRIASNEGPRRNRAAEFSELDAPPPETALHSARTIRFLVYLYKRSWARSYLHRGKRARCRFVPTCSDYCVRAVQKYGLRRGLALTGDRLKRCNPSFRGDPIDFP